MISRTVLVGAGDHNRPDRPELDWAAREATARSATLVVIRAYDLSQTDAPWTASTDRMIVEDLRRGAEQQLGAALAYLRSKWPDVRLQSELAEGPAHRVLIDLARSAELTVVGSRRPGALGAALLGSVSTLVAA